LVLLGSSSLDIQRGLDESLAGRFELVPVPHWSFAESHRHFGFDLDEYLAFGGYPEAARFRADPRRWRDYLLNSIIDSVVGKDILRNHTVRKPALFRQCFELLCALPAQEISYNKLLGQLQEGGNVELVKYYIELFEGAFLLRSLPKFTGSIVRQKASSPKILPLCPALSSAVLGNAVDDGGATRGRLFEAAVGAMLLQLPGTLSYWREKNGLEVDFVCQLGKDLIACEVKSGRKKNTRGLDAFLQAYPKARTLFITPQNFAAFSKAPETFIERVL
jgi:predicted AAA+ superfamily ATPase